MFAPKRGMGGLADGRILKIAAPVRGDLSDEEVPHPPHRSTPPKIGSSMPKEAIMSAT
jgi:hypothetical protein